MHHYLPSYPSHSPLYRNLPPLFQSPKHKTQMAKGGKLMKLRSVLKKLNSFNKQTRPSMVAAADEADDCPTSCADLQAVYVGKSRRRYLLTPDIVDHPLFRELATESSDNTINVSCEVVLFEHLLWMLENADPQPDSLDELVQFYAC